MEATGLRQRREQNKAHVQKIESTILSARMLAAQAKGLPIRFLKKIMVRCIFRR